MPISAFTSPVPGLWPLGKIIVATPGTTVALNSIVGPQTQGGSFPGGSTSTKSGRALKLMAGNANTGVVYLLHKVVGVTVTAVGTPNFICDMVWPGQPSFSPSYFLGAATINPDDYVLDADTAGNWVQAVLYFG